MMWLPSSAWCQQGDGGDGDECHQQSVCHHRGSLIVVNQERELLFHCAYVPGYCPVAQIRPGEAEKLRSEGQHVFNLLRFR